MREGGGGRRQGRGRVKAQGDRPDLKGGRAALVSRVVQHEVAGNLTAGPNEAHNVGVKGQLALQVNLLLEQLQGLRVQP